MLGINRIRDDVKQTVPAIRGAVTAVCAVILLAAVIVAFAIAIH